MGPAMLLAAETEIAYRRETMMHDLARTGRSWRSQPAVVGRGPVVRGLRRLALGKTTVSTAHG